jgi:hypothetical protein
VNSSIVIEALWRNAVLVTGVQLVQGKKIAMQSIELAESENGYNAWATAVDRHDGLLGQVRRLVAAG